MNGMKIGRRVMLNVEVDFKEDLEPVQTLLLRTEELTV